MREPLWETEDQHWQAGDISGAPIQGLFTTLPFPVISSQIAEQF